MLDNILLSCNFSVEFSQIPELHQYITKAKLTRVVGLTTIEVSFVESEGNYDLLHSQLGKTFDVRFIQEAALGRRPIERFAGKALWEKNVVSTDYAANEVSTLVVTLKELT